MEMARVEFKKYMVAVNSFPREEWETLEKTEEYNWKLQKKDSTKTWRDDTSETAGRLWE